MFLYVETINIGNKFLSTQVASEKVIFIFKLNYGKFLPSNHKFKSWGSKKKDTFSPILSFYDVSVTSYILLVPLK